MSLYYLDNCEEHGKVIETFLNHTIEKMYANDPETIKQLSVDKWIDLCLSKSFDEWKKKDEFNFAQWLRRRDEIQIFETPRMLDELIFYINDYFKAKYNINWAYQTDNLYPKTIINTYASVYARKDSFNTINNFIETKTMELIEKCEK